MTDSAETTQAAPPDPICAGRYGRSRTTSPTATTWWWICREMQRTRLELLAEELAQVFAQVRGRTTVSTSPSRPAPSRRLWIDAVAHVAMGRDRRTYRFVRDTRLGRVVLAESLDMKAVAERVTRYVAERVVEREGCSKASRTPVRGRLPPIRQWPSRWNAAKPAAAPAGGRKANRRGMDSFPEGVRHMLLLGVVAGAQSPPCSPGSGSRLFRHRLRNRRGGRPESVSRRTSRPPMAGR
jgi:hypothetical protein